MVFKVSKGGVRSGNTLRGLQSKRTKLYGRHACLLGSSSLNLRDLSKLLPKSSDEDHLVADTLKRTNVLLSLNKKQRWLVPAKINQMISSGNFNSKTMVSLLERHKLKRRANCVRFTSSSEKLPDVAPKQRKYFSFSLDTIDEEQSNREKRRAKADQLKKQKSPQDGASRRLKEKITVIEAFTHHGRKMNTNTPLDSSKQEYRVEVFYPCPQSCSLTYNPKYTDVVLEEGKTGDLEIKANVKMPRNQRKRHRRRFTGKVYEQFYDQIIEEDVREMWDDLNDNEEITKQDHDHEDCHFQPSNYNLFEMLMNQAEKARKLCVLEKHQHMRETFPSQSCYVKRPPLVYEEPRKIDTTTSIQTTPQYDQEIKPLDFVKVILNSSEIEESTLKQKYGALYSEASCYPRRFMIDISDDVANLFSSSKSSSKSLHFVSYLVFIRDGCYDDGLDVFKVILNSFSSKYTKSLSEYNSLSETSIDDIMNNLFGCLLDCTELKEVSSQHTELCREVKDRYNFLHSCANLNVNTFMPSMAILEKISADSFQEDVDKENTMRDVYTHLDQDVFCDICYDMINPTKLDAVAGTKLRKCGHHCCDSCWATHFNSSIRDGKTMITCPGYNCSTEIGLVTLLSIIEVFDVALLFQRKAEREVEKSKNSKWCPNTACGRAIQIDTESKDLSQDIVCACGTEICFECFGSAHWPAKCYQAKEYFEKLTKMKQPEEDLGDPNANSLSLPKEPKSKEAQVFEVEGRVCPRCDSFINKEGGCNHMVCRCGFNFCWSCMKPTPNGLCVIDHKYVLRLTRSVRVCHKEQQKVVASPLTSKSRPKKENSKQKATLYQHAFQQRLETSSSSSSSEKALVTKIVSTAHKDLRFKQEIITALDNLPVPETEEKLKTLNIRRQVERLIKSSHEIKSVLHHVAEFSYILLQDVSHSVEKQRILRLATDISGICSFIRSILDQGENQNAIMAFQRLMSMQHWAKRALDALIVATHKLRKGNSFNNQKM